MKRQIIILAAFLVIALTGWALLSGVTKAPAKPCATACKKETTPKASSGPSTGFFIVDSFSGIL
ncbi:hypothetical protein PDL71_17820 [Lacibacter sp. MH-610]|uniref:hypothetical protein n=1 Tax=Lacibacter sp. MH-610 TaxID=3020883 RepID=UPI003892AE42